MIRVVLFLKNRNKHVRFVKRLTNIKTCNSYKTHEMIRTLILFFTLSLFIACADQETPAKESIATTVVNKEGEPEKKGVANPPAKTKED